MLEKIKDILTLQLQKNLEEQDFYKNIYTELSFGDVVVRFLHPWYIKDNLSGHDIFPEKAQTDIEKAFEPSIAMYLAFSMKHEKMQLEQFRNLVEFDRFKEIKDFGSRMYAVDFGVNVQAATDMCLSVIQSVYNVKTAKSITITTFDVDGGDQIMKRMIRPPKKAPEPIKIDGLATRVMEEKNVPQNTIASKEIAGSTVPSEPTKKDISDSTYNTGMWLIGIIVAVAIFVFIVKGNEKQREPNVTSFLDSVNRVSNSSLSHEERAKILGINDQEKPSQSDVQEEKPNVDLIGRWRESYSGRAGYIWQLQKQKSNGKLQVVISHPVGTQTMTETYQCTKKTKGYGGTLFYDPNVSSNNGVFNLKSGTITYVIPGFDVNGENAIMVMMPDKTVRVYLYNMDSNCFELFENLISVN